MKTNVPNLDDMTQEDLNAFTHKHYRGGQYRLLFPEGGRGTQTAAKDLYNYAANKHCAMSQRKIGNITTALKYEEICQKIYDDLPTFARW